LGSNLDIGPFKLSIPCLELWQLCCIPSAADGLDEENAGIYTSPHNVDVIALVCQQYRLRRDDL
jgi:hypothetical protein